MIIGLSNTTVAGFNGANAIVIRSPQSSLDQIKDVISKIDKQRDQVMIECKFVELNDQAIKDLGINWQSLQGWSVGIQTPRINLAKTTTKRNSINKDFKTQDVKVNTTVNQSQNASSSQSANGATALAGTSSSSVFNNTPPAPPTQTDLNSQNESTTGNSSASQAQSSSRNTSIISGNGFSDFDATSGKATIVPTANNLTENIDFGQKEIVNALSAVLSADTFQATLSALQQNDGIEVVSNPKIIVASGQTAQIHVGQNEPNIIQTQVPNGSSGFQTTFELDQRTPFIELGVLLNVTPVLNTSNNISLKLKPELTRKLSDKVVGSSGQTFPVTETRKVETEFSIESGRTVALGGLTQTTDREKVTKIPILGDIPIIGTYLFRHTHKEKIQDEIIIFVTASVAMPSGLAQVSGIPEEAKLIHRHLAKKVEEATKAEELAKKKAQKATLPK
jgi:type II secretory pathway component GspD/PulD (secretin)